MTRPGRCGTFALFLAAAVLSASAASARTETLRWTQSTSPVDNFKVYWGPTSASCGSYPSSLPTNGVPPKDTTGVYSYDLVVPDAGTIFFRVTALNSGLESGCSNEISRSGITGGTPPPPPPTTTTCPAGQFLAQYFANQDLSGTPTLSRCEAAPLNYQWGTGTAAPGLPTDFFSGRWVGTFAFDAATYRFTATVDDGVRVFVDGQTVIDQWNAQSAATFTGDRALSAGSHEVKIEYFEAGGAATLQASWAPAGTTTPPPSTTLGAPGQPYIVP